MPGLRPVLTAESLMAFVWSLLKEAAEQQNAYARRYGGPRWTVKASADGAPVVTVTATQRGVPDATVVIAATDL